jgi:DNA-binding LacI/PurR family transcriptional regulator
LIHGRGDGRYLATEPFLETFAAPIHAHVALASLALRGEPGVLPAKRAKILKVAAQMNYRPNPLARNLASAETRTLGVLIGQILNPYVALLAREIDEVARERGYDVLLSINGSPDAAAEMSIDGLVAHRVAGIILVDSPTSDAIIEAVGQVLPVVYVGRQLSTLHVDSVSTDDYLGANLVVHHLADLGHRRIAHIDGGTGAGAPSSPRRIRRGHETAQIRIAADRQWRIFDRRRRSRRAPTDASADASDRDLRRQRSRRARSYELSRPRGLRGTSRCCGGRL